MSDQDTIIKPIVFVPEKSKNDQKQESIEDSISLYDQSIISKAVKDANEGFYCEDCGTVITDLSKEKHDISIQHLVAKQNTTKVVDYKMSRRDKGYQLLEEEGWERGKGLGADEQGRDLPISTRLKHDRKGIGMKSELKKKIVHDVDDLKQAQEEKRKAIASGKKRSRKEIEAEHVREQELHKALQYHFRK
jgi:hypothetical protein